MKLTEKNKKRLASKKWRINHLYKVIDKNEKLVTFKEKEVQEKYNNEAHSRNIILKSRQHGFCLDPSTRILTADLRWVAIKDIKVGKKIISVDEFNNYGQGKGRKMKIGIVEDAVRLKRQSYKITFDDGREVICTGKHPWLSRKARTQYKWRSIEGREDFKGKLTVGTKVRWITKPWDDGNFEDGWFGGILDGEGSMRHCKNHSNGISVSQRKGLVWDKMIDYCKREGYHYEVREDKRKSKLGKDSVFSIRFGRMDEIFKLIGKTRPSRFLGNRFWKGRELPGKKTSIGQSKIIKIKKMGVREMIDLQTSVGTYIAEGFVSHNTTNACIDGLDDVLFNRNFKFTIIADSLNHAKEIFEKIQVAWDNFPLRRLYQSDTESAREISFNNGSIARVTTSARSTTVNRLHISELGEIAAKYPKKAREIITGSIPAVPTKGRVDIESTAKGETGLFYELCQEFMDKEPKSPLDFKFHFFGWIDDKDCSLEGDIPIPQDLKEYQKKHNISDSQIKWYSEQRKSLKEDIKQEYPTYPDEAFMYSGRKFYDQDIVDSYMDNTQEGRKEGNWIYYEEYKPGHRYGLGADVSEGVGRASNTIVIWDFTPEKPKIVAEYENNEIAPDLFAHEIKNGGEKYGMAVVAPERNNPGHATITELKHIYPVNNIYSYTRTDRRSDEKTKLLGWDTNLTTKPKMMYELRRAVHDNLVDIPSKYILKEMRTYNTDDLSEVKRDEDTTQHWDRLIATAIGFQMKDNFKQEKIVQFRPKWVGYGKTK